MSDPVDLSVVEAPDPRVQPVARLLAIDQMDRGNWENYITEAGQLLDVADAVDPARIELVGVRQRLEAAQALCEEAESLDWDPDVSGATPKLTTKAIRAALGLDQT